MNPSSLKGRFNHHHGNPMALELFDGSNPMAAALGEGGQLPPQAQHALYSNAAAAGESRSLESCTTSNFMNPYEAVLGGA